MVLISSKLQINISTFSSVLPSYEHSELGQMLADCCIKKKLKLMPFMTTIYDKYVLNMAKDGTYADHIAVILMSQILCVKIALHQETAR